MPRCPWFFSQSNSPSTWRPKPGIPSALPRLTRGSLLRLLANQAHILSSLRNLIGNDSIVFYTLALRPETLWETPLRECIDFCETRQWVLLELRFWLEDRWQITGPATRDGTVILPRTHTDRWAITDY